MRHPIPQSEADKIGGLVYVLLWFLDQEASGTRDPGSDSHFGILKSMAILSTFLVECYVSRAAHRRIYSSFTAIRAPLFIHIFTQTHHISTSTACPGRDTTALSMPLKLSWKYSVAAQIVVPLSRYCIHMPSETSLFGPQLDILLASRPWLRFTQV
jgi:hypothetical protein